MSEAIEKFKDKSFSTYYTLEISMVCKNCGTSKGRWRAASDSATSFDFILTTCEYCGCFRFEATLYAKFFDNRDEKNLQLSKSKHGKEIQADLEAIKRIEGPIVIKKVEGERLTGKAKAVDEMSSLKASNWRAPIEDNLPERETPEGLMGTPPYDHGEE